ncbi:hypothetical protein ACFWXK_25240 [Streptomyces sp. NPDC059070]|uniref:hypothetical protein n=1 Tax=Streptomyces sp. NPDC059070 TaxID=3346713 RepID=UPI0036A5805A
MKILPLHPDDTECTHAVRPSGKPRGPNAGCADRRNYAVVCSACGPVGEPHGLHVLAQPEQTKHRASHKAALTPASHCPHLPAGTIKVLAASSLRGPMLTTVFDQFAYRTTYITAQLTTLGIPLTAPAPPPADLNLADSWASSYDVPLDRTSLAWCTAVRMLADHHHTGIDRQVVAADALLRELGARGLAQLHSDLHRGVPIDYRFTRCPYCSGIGEDPTQPTCGELGCPPWHEFDGHEHLCPVCHGDDHQPQWFAEQHMAELEELLADAIEENEERVSLPYRIRRLLRRRTVRT